MDTILIQPDDSVAIIESLGFMAAARLVQLISQESRARIVAVSPMNATGAVTTVIAGSLAEVQYALQLAKNGNAVSDSTFFARPQIETIEMLLRSAFGSTPPVQRKQKQPEPLPLFETSESTQGHLQTNGAARTMTNGTTTSHNSNSPNSKSLSDLESYPVHELRRYARSIAGFPIQGREISKANRSELLQLIKTTEERSRTQAAREAASGSIAEAHEVLTSNVTSN